MATKSGRTISFPAWVNQREGVIEYALVMRAGKTHEALFATDADAKDLNVAILLLGLTPDSIIGKPNETWRIPETNSVSIRAMWKEGDNERSYSLSELIVLRDVKRGEPERRFPDGPWFYNGSRVIEGGAFLAQTSGSILSLIFDPDALINNPYSDRNDDDIHFLDTALLPPVGTPVTISFQLGLKPGATSLSGGQTNRASARTDSAQEPAKVAPIAPP